MRLKTWGYSAVLAVVAIFSLSLDTSPAAASAAASTNSGCLPASVRATLSAIRSKFGSIEIVSTFRRGARIAGTGHKSYHASCRAVDFHPARGSYGRVLAWLKSNFRGGLGTYSCGMHHLHIDNGPKVRFHHCVTASGAIIGGSKKHYARKKSHTLVATAVRTSKTKSTVAKLRLKKHVKLEPPPAP